jgi:DNA-binding NarL/FixJ family response regulator
MEYQPRIARSAPTRHELRFVLKFVDGIPQFKIDGNEFHQIAMASLKAQANEAVEPSFEEFLRVLGDLIQAAPATQPALTNARTETGLDVDELAQLIDEFAVEKLSVREVEVLRLVVNGDSNKQIARRLNIAEPTVKCHVKSILRKLNARNRFEAAMWAMKLRFGEKA